MDSGSNIDGLRMACDPDIPPAIRHDLQNLPYQPPFSTEEPPAPPNRRAERWWALAALPTERRREGAEFDHSRTMGEVLAIVVGVLLLMLSSRADTTGAMLTLVCGGTLALLGGAGSAAFAVRKISESRIRPAQLRHDFHGRYIQPLELVAEARPLLARAQAAVQGVQGSAVNRFDLLDRQRNGVTLPAHEWEIATALAEYSRLIREQRITPQGEQAAAVLGIRSRQLAVILEGIEQRVQGLEAYASETAEADARYAELQQLNALSTGDGAILDLAARAAADQLAIAEIQGLTAEATAVASAFRDALESARSAGVRALPETA
ncbi:hypothetical protein [Streptomyces sp. HUAS TT7]|uniref:hypothetical protein n=1 Tax=Streptomyces sp. HUAS TT7 TaxID=3447507 RepID=UPI003F65529D